MGGEKTEEGGTFSRRQVLEGVGAAGVSLLAGCANDKNTTETNNRTDTPTETETETATETNPLEQTHSADNLDSVVQQLEQNSVSLNLQPADPNAEYAQSTIFNDYNGELNVAINLDQVFEQRRINNEVMEHPRVKDFYENAHRKEWREEKHQGYLERFNGENVLEFQEEIDWDLYMNGDNLDERIEESGVQDLFYKFTLTHPELGSISSVHNGIKAAAYQKLDQKHRFDTFYWSHDSAASEGDHGLVAATENPTRDPEQVNQQENYTIETNYQVEDEIQTVAESNFFQGDADNLDVEHPAEQDYNNKEMAMYGGTAIMKGESRATDLYHRANNFPESLAHHFTDEWFRNPTSEPAFKHFDRMNAAVFLVEENSGEVHHTEDEFRYEA